MQRERLLGLDELGAMKTGAGRMRGWLKGMAWLGLLAGSVVHAGTVYLEYTDPQGTVLAETDVHGNILARYDYRPYGGVVSGTGPDGPGYTGHVNDPDTGLVYMQQRYYDPVTGRFLSVDPIGMGVSAGFAFNRYSYAFNNPITLGDPEGAYPANMSSSQMECEISHCSTMGDGSMARSQRAIRAISEANKALRSAHILGRPYNKLNDLVNNWSDAVVPVATRLQVEIGSDIMYAKDSGYLCSQAYSTGDRTTIDFSEIRKSFVPGLTAEIHTHPVNVGFSGMKDWASQFAPFARGGGDLAHYYDNHINGYVALPNGAIYGWNYNSFIKRLNYSNEYYQSLRDTVYTVRGK